MPQLNKNQQNLKVIIDFIVQSVIDVQTIIEDRKVTFAESASLFAKAFGIPRVVKCFAELNTENLADEVKALQDIYPGTNIDEIATKIVAIVVNIKELVQLFKR